jgi:putative ABC transport system permease protein
MTRFYRAMLGLYPERFRAEYREEMCRAFVERTRGRSSVATLAMAIADVVPNAIAAHWDVLRHGAAAGTAVPAFAGDIRFALRQIARAPLLSGVIITVIALGIGINAGLLTILNTYAWRPALGIPPDAALARLTPTAVRRSDGRLVDILLSYPDILDLRERRDAFREVAAWTSTNLPVDLAGGAETMRVSYTTANFFRALRVTLAAGSGFPDDLDQSTAPVVVIGQSLWMTNFGGSPDVIGKTIRVMNLPFTIVGVAPERFVGFDIMNLGQPTIWLPLGARAILELNAATDLPKRDVAIFRSVVRLAPGIVPGDVARLTAPLAARLAQQEPETRARFSLRAERLTGMAGTRSDRTELVASFLLVAALIVVITCTNVSALLLGRAAARRREIGVRLSLGATRLRLIRQMLTESLVLALAGALLGLALYVPTVKIAYAMAPELVYGLEPEPATFLFATLFALVTTIVFGLAPALHATSADIGEVMKNSGNHAIRRSRLQMTFVVIQLACSQPVLVVTSLVLADIRRGVNENADQAPASVAMMSWRLNRPESDGVADHGSRYPALASSHDVLRAVRRRLAAVPGVRSIAIITDGHRRPDQSKTPMVSFNRVRDFDVARGRVATVTAHVAQLYVNNDYFTTLATPIVRGRAIGVDDDRLGSSAVVVNEAAAELLWPGQDPIGKRLVRRDAENAPQSTSLEVIGVVGAPPYDKQQTEPIVFAPLSTAASAWESTLAVRTSGDARAYVPWIRTAIREVEPYAAIDDVNVTRASGAKHFNRTPLPSRLALRRCCSHRSASTRSLRSRSRSVRARSAFGSRSGRRRATSCDTSSEMVSSCRRSASPSACH